MGRRRCQYDSDDEASARKRWRRVRTVLFVVAKGIIYVHRHTRLAMLVTRGGKPRIKEKGPVRRFWLCGGDGGGNKDAGGDRDSKQSSDDAKPKRKVK